MATWTADSMLSAFGDGDTRGEALIKLRGAFGEAGIVSPGIDARRLLELVLDIDAADLLLHPETVLADKAGALTLAARRRLDREPISRIAGRRGFRDLELTVTADTLDPRPDTETLVEAVLEIAAEEGWRERPLRILDFGTGSGCLLLSLLAELPMASGIGSDISSGALSVARGNADALGMGQRARLVLADGLRPLIGLGPFDLLVSNPPYIPTGEIESLEPEVRRYDPRAALDGGIDGFDLHRHIVANAGACAPQGWVGVEIGAGQSDMFIKLLENSGTSRTAGSVRTRIDLGGHPRCVTWKPQN